MTVSLKKSAHPAWTRRGRRSFSKVKLIVTRNVSGKRMRFRRGRTFNLQTFFRRSDRFNIFPRGFLDNSEESPSWNFLIVHELVGCSTRISIFIYCLRAWSKVRDRHFRFSAIMKTHYSKTGVDFQWSFCFFHQQIALASYKLPQKNRIWFNYPWWQGFFDYRLLLLGDPANRSCGMKLVQQYRVLIAPRANLPVEELPIKH